MWLPVFLAWFLSTAFFMAYLAVLDVIRLPLARVIGHQLFLLPGVLPELLLRFAIVVVATSAAMGLLWCLRGFRRVFAKPWRAGLAGAFLGLAYALSRQAGLRHDWTDVIRPSCEMLALMISSNFFNTVLPAGLCGFLLSAFIRQAMEKEQWLESRAGM